MRETLERISGKTKPVHSKWWIQQIWRDRWTREQGEEKSIIDYVITTKRDLNTIKSMKIDEQKEFGIYKVEIQGAKQSRKIYSDHNAVMLDIDFICKMEAKGKKKPLQEKVIKSTKNS